MSENTMNRRPVTVKDIAAALGLSVNTTHVYLSKNTTHPAAMRTKEAARAMGWTQKADAQRYADHPTVLEKIQQVIPTLTHSEKPVTMRDIAAKLGVSFRTVQRAFAKTDGRNQEVAQAIRTAAQIMGYIPGRSKPRTVKPDKFWHSGNFLSRDAEIARMRQLRAEGYTNAEIARKLGRSYGTVYNTIGKQDAAMTKMSVQMAGAARAQKSAVRAAYVRNKPIAAYNAKVQELTDLRAKVNALETELAAAKPAIDKAAAKVVEMPVVALANLQPTALN